MTRNINARLGKLEEQLRPKHRRSFAPTLEQILSESCRRTGAGKTTEKARASAEKVLLMFTTLGGKTAEERRSAYDRLIDMGEVPWGAMIDADCNLIGRTGR